VLRVCLWCPLQNETGALQRLSTPCTSAANGGDRSGAQLDECVGGGVWRMGGLARRGESLLGACRWLIWWMIRWMMVVRRRRS